MNIKKIGSHHALSRIHKMDIAVKRIASPKDYQDSMHHYGGAVYGLSLAAGPGAQFPSKMPIHGLFQAGQTAYPGYGVGPAAMSGIFCGRSVNEDGWPPIESWFQFRLSLRIEARATKKARITRAFFVARQTATLESTCC